MGVIACSRNGCERIMCDHYSDVYGYICYECMSELKAQTFVGIGAFMNRPRNEVCNNSKQEQWESLIDDTFEQLGGE